MKIALVGNPNSGKTTLFNQLTRLNQKIGNWPGVTIEKKEGRYYKDKSIEIIDLPGVYSLNPISEDEKVTCNYLENSSIDAVINVVDSTNLERNLFLTLQLLERNIPVVVAMNMQDELKINGLTLDIDVIQKELKTFTVLISALKNKNITLLMDKAKEAAQINHAEVFANSGTNDETKAEFRHNFINEKINLFRVKTTSRAKKITEKIDKIVTNKWLAFPIFAAVIYLMYFVSIQSVGALTIEGMEWLFGEFIGENLRSGLMNIGAAEWITSLLVDGIIGGVGAVLTFVPQIIILFLFITFLEGCGYMARVAVIMDRIFKKLGLSGKSFIPMIVGCGCSVPAIMSAKTIEGDSERKATIMLTPFIPCSAKLPVFALIAGALFPNNSFVAPSMYFLGIFMVIVGGLFLKLFRKKKTDTAMFLIELPHYRLPKIKNVLLELWDKARGFIIKAGTVIVPAAIVLWFLQSFNFKFQMSEINESMLAYIGRGIAWIFAPLGFGNWQSAIAVITGFFAKETVVATFGILLGEEGLSVALKGMFTPHGAYAFMVFILLSAPCLAAIGATKKEMGSAKRMLAAVGFQCGAAYIVALIINQLGNLYVYNSTAFVTVLIALVIAAVGCFCIIRLIKNAKNGGGCSCSCQGCGKKGSCKKAEEITESEK